jgi:vacuolar-type H+-ATPase subunit E/Vma4
MLDSAETSAAMMDREADAQVQQDIARQRLVILSRAALSARQVLMQAKHEVLDAVWRRARERALVLDGPERVAVLRGLLMELLAVAPPGPLKAVLEEREQSLFGPSLQERGIPYEVRYDDDLLLGVEVETDGAVLRNSLAGRMRKAKPELYAELNRLLFAER